jgi:hypothetical protein
MTASKNLTTLDFQSIKQNLKDFLSDPDQNPAFKDYDFEASNINVLLDVLAYNTSLNGFYLNMIANEMFLDSALLRDSIISHAKELNYVPRSFRSAYAKVKLTLTDTTDDATIIIPRGTAFTGTEGNRNFVFTTAENIQALNVSGTTFEANNVVIYEGDYIQDSFVVDGLTTKRYIASNKTIDTNSLKVTVIEDNGATVLSYEKTESLFGISASDQVYFIQAAENDSYEILFGDGIIGRKPKTNSIVLMEYRTCNGELPNGINKFTPNGKIGTATITKVDTLPDGRASGGSIPESLESIKLNAPRAFTTQNRVVTANDYATLLKANFSEINDVAAYGGEEFDPPMYGKVIVAVDLKNTDELPKSFRDKYRLFIKPRSPLSLDPVFVKPNYLYLSIDTKVKYNITQTSLGVDDIKSLVVSAIQNFNNQNLDGFNKTLFFSRLIAAIDNSQDAIISNDTTVRATKFISVAELVRNNYVLDFDMPLQNDIGVIDTVMYDYNRIRTVESESFAFDGDTCFIHDDGVGNLNIVREMGDQWEVITTIGAVNYNTGRIRLDNFSTGSLKTSFKVTVTPREKDIFSQKKSILRTLDQDIKVTVEQVRL